MWTKELVTLLLKKYQEHENLYNVRDPVYLDRVKRSNSIDAICKDLTQLNKNITVEAIKKKIHTLRSQFLKEVREISNNERTRIGVEEIYEPKLWCFSQLLFLKSHCVIKKSESSDISEVRLDNERGLKIKNLASLEAKPMNKQQHSVLINEITTTAASSTSGVYENLIFESNEPKNNFYDVNARTLESNESFTDSRAVTPTIIKQEVFIEPENLQSENLPETIRQNNAVTIETERQRIFDEDGNGKRFSSPSQYPKPHDEPDDPLDVPVKVFIEDDDFAEPCAKMRRDSSSDYFNEPPYDFEELQHKQSSKYPQDRVDKSPSPSKEDSNFERWLKKRKQTLEVEYQEMLNYEMKLKIWEREQQLKLPRSKFTKNIGI